MQAITADGCFMATLLRARTAVKWRTALGELQKSWKTDITRASSLALQFSRHPDGFVHHHLVLVGQGALNEVEQ